MSSNAHDDDEYRIADEPTGAFLSRWAVEPLWPLLGLMFGGAWLMFPWFALNSFAIGSATKKRELAWIAGGFAVISGFVLALLQLDARGAIPQRAIAFVLLPEVALKIFCAYRLQLLQARSYELHRHFGGTSRNGMLILFIAFWIAQDERHWSLVWRLILS